MLVWQLLPHQPMQSLVPCYTQWMLHVQTRISRAQLTSASAHLQDRNTRKLFPQPQLLWWRTLPIFLQESFSSLTVSGCLTLKQEGHCYGIAAGCVCILGGEGQRNWKNTVRGSWCCTWSFLLLIAAQQDWLPSETSIINYDLIFFFGSKGHLFILTVDRTKNFLESLSPFCSCPPFFLLA